jgi:hypothetical protein
MSDRVPDSFIFMRLYGKAIGDNGPWWNASDETVRFPLVTERSVVPLDKFADETTGFDPPASDEFKTRDSPPTPTSVASVFTPPVRTEMIQLSTSRSCARADDKEAQGEFSYTPHTSVELLPLVTKAPQRFGHSVVRR